MEATQRDAAYKSDPVRWAKEVLGFHMWSKQVEIAEALLEHKKVAVSSCHGSGKSALTAVLIAWWVCTRLDVDAIAMVSAPTYNQLHAIIFESLRKAHEQHSLPGSINLQDEWKDEKGNIVAFGRKPSDQNISAFQGIHRTGGVLVALDEAVGVHENIFVGAEAVTTGRLDKILAIFNPDDVGSYIGKVWMRKDPSWYFISIDAHETPNFTGEWVPDIARNGLVSPEWAEEKKLSWGEDSPRYRSKVLGQFSTSASNTLFSMADLLKGHTNDIEPDPESLPRIGADIARYGEDDSVVYLYHDGHCRRIGQWNKTDLVTTSERIAELAFEYGASEVRIDGVGIGAGVVDNLVRIADNRFQVVSMVGNASSPDLKKWFNARAYWYDTTREKLYRNELDTDIADVQLSEELGGLQFHFKNPRGSLQIEKKEDIKLRTGKSPDYADAFIYACADLGFDPTDPLHSLEPGQEFELDIEQILWDIETTIGPC